MQQSAWNRTYVYLSYNHMHGICNVVHTLKPNDHHVVGKFGEH